MKLNSVFHLQDSHYLSGNVILTGKQAPFAGSGWRNSSALALFLAFLLTAVSQPLLAQSSAQTATLKGVLTDTSASAVSDVEIAAYPDGSPAATAISTQSLADGSYTLLLNPGRYEVKFSRESFAARTVSVTLSAAETHSLNLRLALEPLSSRVIVTAQSVPSTVQQTTAPADVISREDIDDRQAVSLPELLTFSPGIAVGRTGPFGGSTSIFLNGGNSDFTKVLVDGTPINPPGSAVDFSSVTTDNIDKVEIVRGAESAIYGSDAVSGVIQLFTHRGETRTPAFSLRSEGGNFSSARGGADLSGLIGKFDYSGAASYFQTDGQGPNDSFLNRTLSGNFGYALSDTNQLYLSLRNNTSDAGIPGATLTGPPDLFQGYGQKIFSANARWNFTTGSHWHHQLMGTDSYSRQHSFAGPGDAFPYDFLLSFNRVAVNAQSSYVLRTLIATFGYQYEVENGGIEFTSPGHLRRNNHAVYLDFRYTPVSRLTLDFGGRVEANSSFGTRFVPRLGGSYLLRHGRGFFGDTRYRAFYGQGIKEPRFDQTFGTDPCAPGNPDLKPEASKNWTTGVEQKLVSDRWKLSADYFYTRFYDIVSFANCFSGGPCQVIPSCQFGNGFYFNTDLALARGVNFTSEARLRKWLFINGNYTYGDTRVVKSENPFADPALIPGNHLVRRPVHSGSFGVNLNLARVNWNFIGYFTGVRTDSNFASPQPATDRGYARFDMAASYHMTRGLFVTARAVNLFDKQYQDAFGYPALGRYYMFGLHYQVAGRK